MNPLQESGDVTEDLIEYVVCVVLDVLTTDPESLPLSLEDMLCDAEEEDHEWAICMAFGFDFDTPWSAKITREMCLRVISEMGRDALDDSAANVYRLWQESQGADSPTKHRRAEFRKCVDEHERVRMELEDYE